MSDAVCQVRPAGAGDAEAVADLAAGLAQSFPFSRARFDLSYPALLADGDACLLLAVDGEERLGYLLGFRHLTFYANGPAGWVEEVFVRGQERGRGIGRALMSSFEQWAAVRDCALVALATRRAAPFYRAGVRGVRRLLPQDPWRPGRHLRWMSGRCADLGLEPAASKMPLWSAMPTRRASSPW